MAIDQRERTIIKASWIAVAGNAGLSVLKIVVGVFSGSFAVIADGIDSGSDVLTSLITLFTAHVISRPPDAKYPYGYVKADTIATKVLAFIIFFAGAQLAISTFNKLISGATSTMPDMVAIYVVIVSVIGKFLLAWYLRKKGKKINSSMLVANARNMQNDVVISLSVLVGLIAIHIFNLPVIDIITAFCVSLYIMFIAFKIFMESNRELMDGIEDTHIYNKIIAAARSVDGVSNPHRIRVRKMSNYLLISMDIEIDGKLSLKEAHKISHMVENQIKSDIDNVYDVLVHPEPAGDAHPDEVYGVSEGSEL